MESGSKGFLSIHGLILSILLLAFGWIFTDLAWNLHDGMRTHKADLGQVAQAVWNSGHGQFVAMTDNGPLSSRLTDHVEPILAIISPILWLWRDVKALLLLQVLAAVAGGWLLYQIAQENFKTLLNPEEQKQIWLLEPLRNLTTPIALTIVTAFLLSPQIQNALLTEFHAAPLAVPLILWAFYAVEKLAIPDQKSKARYWIQLTLATILTALVKEEMALLAAGLGLWAIYRLTIDDLRLTIRASWHSRTQSNVTPSPDSATLSPPHSLTPSLPHLAILSSPHLLIPLTLTVLCVVWFYLATFVIVPAHAAEVYQTAENPYWARYGALGESPLDIVKSLFTQPGVVWEIVREPVRSNYLWAMLATFGFLCLLAPEILLFSLPLLLANLLSEYPPQYYGEFHYSAPLIAYFGVSAVYGAKRLGYLIMNATKGSSPSYQQMPAAASWVMNAMAMVRNSRTAIRPLLFGGIVIWILGWGIAGYLAEGRGPMGGRSDPVEVNAHHRRLDQFVAQIPWDAALTATAAVHPHVALRSQVYQFPIGMPEFGEQGNADWALLDVTTNTDMAPGDLHARVMEMLAADWGIVDGGDGFLLLKRGAPEKEIPSAFFDFARYDGVSDNADSGDFDGLDIEQRDEDAALMLVDVSVEDRPRWRSTKIVTMWLVGEAFDPEQDAPKFAIHQPSGDLLYSYSGGTPTALIWHPPAAWKPGELIKITSPALTLPRAWGVAVNAGAAPQMDLAISDGKMTLVASYGRNVEDELVSIPLPSPIISGPAFPLAALQIEPQVAVDHMEMFHIGATADEQGLTMTSQLGMGETWPTGTVDLLMRWEVVAVTSGPIEQAWLDQWTPFVHMRRVDGETQVNIAQQDGRPRWFLQYDPEPWLARSKPLWDWRQLVVPAGNDLAGNDLAETELRFVVGLYDPVSGDRAVLLDGDQNPIGNEATVGRLRVAEPPVPDFACAMSPTSCGAQPVSE